MASAPKLGVLPALDSLNSALARCRDASRDLPASELPDFIGELEAVKATAWARLSTPAPTQEHDELLSVEIAAERLGVSKDYLYRHSQEYPFTRRQNCCSRLSESKDTYDKNNTGLLGYKSLSSGGRG